LASIGRPRPPPAFATRISIRAHSWTTLVTIASTACGTDIHLDPKSGAARRLNLGDGAVRGLGLLIRAEVQVGDRDLGP
jgi:hypothetical protein